MKKHTLKYYYGNYVKRFPHGKNRTIFVNHWKEYKSKYYVRPVEEKNVLKMLSCRTPLLGKHIYPDFLLVKPNF